MTMLRCPFVPRTISDALPEKSKNKKETGPTKRKALACYSLSTTFHSWRTLRGATCLANWPLAACGNECHAMVGN